MTSYCLLIQAIFASSAKTFDRVQGEGPREQILARVIYSFHVTAFTAPVAIIISNVVIFM